jgi:predicted small secreted protein
LLKRLVALLSLAGLVVGGLAACNTMQGFGQDMQAGGKAIEKAADKSKPK